MGLENAINDLTKAVNGYTAVLEAAIAHTANKAAKTEEVKEAPKAKTKAKAEPKTEAPVAEEAAPVEEAPATSEVTEDEIKKATLRAVQELDKGPEVKAILAKLGVAKATLVPAAKRGEYMEALAKLEAADADEDLI